MRISNTLNTVEGAEGVAFGVASGPVATRVLMTMLTSAYSDPHQAVMRELVANGMDSHKVAGQTRPVEVTLTQAVDGTTSFVVRDYGTGMSREFIESVYVNYVASTKRGDGETDADALAAADAQIGGFGIGGKSPLAIADGYTIESVCDGEVTVVSVAVDEAGSPEATFLHHGETDAENGVRITVPISDRVAMERAALAVLTWLPVGAATFNGSPSGDGWADNEGLPDGCAWRGTSYHEPRWKVVMNGIAYNVDSAVDNHLSDIVANLGGLNWSADRFVVTVPDGSVDLPLSRETVIGTPRSKEAIGQAVADMCAHMREHVTKEVEAAETRSDAIRALAKMRRLMNNLGVGNTWDSETWGRLDLATSVYRIGEPYEPTNGTLHKARLSEITADLTSRLLIVKGEISAYSRQFVAKMIEVEELEIDYVISVPEFQDSFSAGPVWWGQEDDPDSVLVMTMEDIKAIAKPHMPKREPRPRGERQPRRERTYDYAVFAGGRATRHGTATMADIAAEVTGDGVLVYGDEWTVRSSAAQVLPDGSVIAITPSAASHHKVFETRALNVGAERYSEVVDRLAKEAVADPVRVDQYVARMAAWDAISSFRLIELTNALAPHVERIEHEGLKSLIEDSRLPALPSTAPWPEGVRERITDARNAIEDVDLRHLNVLAQGIKSTYGSSAETLDAATEALLTLVNLAA